jgi:hypothetical protein
MVPITTRHPGRCHNCGEAIAPNTPAYYDPATKTLSHRAADPYDCGPPIDAPRARTEPFRPDTTPAQDWALGKTD